MQWLVSLLLPWLLFSSQLSLSWSESDHVIPWFISMAPISLWGKEDLKNGPKGSTGFSLWPHPIAPHHSSPASGFCAAPLTHEECSLYKNCFSAWTFPSPCPPYSSLPSLFLDVTTAMYILTTPLKSRLRPTLQIPLPCFIFFFLKPLALENSTTFTDMICLLSVCFHQNVNSTRASLFVWFVHWYIPRRKLDTEASFNICFLN